jgi:hypothetical protein
VIRSFRSADTERLFNRESVWRFRAIERQALRKLEALHAVPALDQLATVPETGWKDYAEIAKASTAFASTISGASASCGAMETLMKWKSWTTTRRKEWRES